MRRVARAVPQLCDQVFLRLQLLQQGAYRLLVPADLPLQLFLRAVLALLCLVVRVFLLEERRRHEAFHRRPHLVEARRPRLDGRLVMREPSRSPVRLLLAHKHQVAADVLRRVLRRHRPKFQNAARTPEEHLRHAPHFADRPLEVRPWCDSEVRVFRVCDCFAVRVLAEHERAGLVLDCAFDALLAASSAALRVRGRDQVGKGAFLVVLDGSAPAEDEFSLSFSVLPEHVVVTNY